MWSTGVGSLPGEDFLPWCRFVVDTFGEAGHVFVPELPARGLPSGMIGRTLAMLDVPADVQPAGWRLASGSGVDQRRARSVLSRDLDEFEEALAPHTIARVKQQLTGPLTLAATVERPRGDKLLADHGARRELAHAVAQAAADQVSELQRRTAAQEVTIQIDEPSIGAVLAGRVPTASSFGRHRAVHLPEADALLSVVADAIVAAGAKAVVHSCAADLPVALLAGAGFSAVSFDVSLNQASDPWAEAFEAGTDFWFGTLDPKSVESFMSRLGFEPGVWSSRSTLTPACGLAGETPRQARRTLEGVAGSAASLS